MMSTPFLFSPGAVYLGGTTAGPRTVPVRSGSKASNTPDFISLKSSAAADAQRPRSGGTVDAPAWGAVRYSALLIETMN